MLRIRLGVAAMMANTPQMRIRQLRQLLRRHRVVRAEDNLLPWVGPRRVVGPLLLVHLLRNRLLLPASPTLNLHELSS